MLPILHRIASSAGRFSPAIWRVDHAAGDRRGSTGRRSWSVGFDAAGSFRQLIVRLDANLSRRADVRTYANDPRCLLRLATSPAPCNARLPDGTTISEGARIVDLHLWNEHVPPVPKAGPNLAWGRAVWERLDFSMQELAHAMRTDPSLRGVQACRARTNFDGPGSPTEAISRLTKRCGFGDVDEGASTLGASIHDGFENVLIAALVWTHNPEALCRRNLRRVRRPVWISRERLLTLYPER